MLMRRVRYSTIYITFVMFLLIQSILIHNPVFFPLVTDMDKENWRRKHFCSSQQSDAGGLWSVWNLYWLVYFNGNSTKLILLINALFRTVMYPKRYYWSTTPALMNLNVPLWRSSKISDPLNGTDVSCHTRLLAKLSSPMPTARYSSEWA